MSLSGFERSSGPRAHGAWPRDRHLPDGRSVGRLSLRPQDRRPPSQQRHMVPVERQDFDAVEGSRPRENVDKALLSLDEEKGLGVYLCLLPFGINIVEERLALFTDEFAKFPDTSIGAVLPKLRYQCLDLAAV